MKRNKKRLLAFLLAMVMVVSLIPNSFYVKANETESALDFSSCELLVATDNPEIFTEDTEVVSEYDGVYLVRFENAELAKTAYEYYSSVADFADTPDGIL
jgi:hypothetical protein